MPTTESPTVKRKGRPRSGKNRPAIGRVAYRTQERLVKRTVLWRSVGQDFQLNPVSSGMLRPIQRFVGDAQQICGRPGRGGDTQECLAAGMDSVLTKPVSVEKLRALLETFAARKMSGRTVAAD